MALPDWMTSTPPEAKTPLTPEEIAKLPLAERLQRGRQAAATGTRLGVEGLPGMIGDMPGMVGGAIEWGLGKAPDRWVSPEQAAEAGEQASGTLRTVGKAVTGGYAADVILKALTAAGILSPERAEAIMAETEPPTSADIHSLTSGVLPEEINQYTEGPESPNRIERGIATAASMLPNLPGGAGAGVRQALTRFGTRVAAPTVVDIGIGEVTDRLVQSGKISPRDAAAIRVMSQVLTGAPATVTEKALGARAAASQAGQVTPQALRELEAALIQDGMDPATARAKVAEWGGSRSEGGEVMIADLGEHGNVEQLGIKAGVTPGPGGAELKRKLKQRSGFAGERIRGEQQQALGAPVNRDVELERFKKRARTVGGQYDLAKDKQVRPSATQAIADQLDAELAVARGGLRGPLEEVRKSLDLPGAPGNLDPSAEGLHQMRQALDQQISGAEPGTPLFNRLTHYRKLVDTELKDIAPDLKQLDVRYSRIKGEEEAFEAGEGALSKAGKIVPSPEEFRTTWNAFAPREKQAALKGANRWVDQQTGLTDRERTKLKSVLGGEWNEAKLITMIGEAKTKRLMAAMEREDVFQDRYNKIVHGSKTASAVNQDMPSAMQGAPTAGAATLLMTGDPMAAAGVVGMTTAKNWVTRKLARVEGAQRLKNDIGKLLASDRPEDVFRAMEQLRKVDKTAVMPRAMLTALYARMNETGHR